MMTHGFDFNTCKPEKGMKQIGWMCSYTPEELILAAGFTPIRISSNELSSGQSESYLPPNICPYTRNILDRALNADFEALDGVVFTYSCDAMRRLADAWEEQISCKVIYRLDVPRRRDEPAVRFFCSQLQSMLDALCSESGQRVTQADLAGAIALTNETRHLIKQLSRHRERLGSTFNGSDFFRIVQTSMNGARDKFNGEARKLVSRLENIKSTEKKFPKLLITGCVVDTSALHEVIEDCGAAIIHEDLCNGLRHFEDSIEESPNPLEAIACRYLFRSPCSRMVGAKDRLQLLMRLIQTKNVDGVIFHSLKFCDLVQSDLPIIHEYLSKRRIPLLHIDRDYSDSNSGQNRTRLEAFLEMLMKNQGKQ
jgi:benzoyl-CoA reductase/2-hydroxyglutaryl-CoA dehydratase subunit BcrC/BadD/HgdB